LRKSLPSSRVHFFELMRGDLILPFEPLLVSRSKPVDAAQLLSVAIELGRVATDMPPGGLQPPTQLAIVTTLFHFVPDDL
jgi:hypothetical protein